MNTYVRWPPWVDARFASRRNMGVSLSLGHDGRIIVTLPASAVLAVAAVRRHDTCGTKARRPRLGPRIYSCSTQGCVGMSVTSRRLGVMPPRGRTTRANHATYYIRCRLSPWLAGAARIATSFWAVSGASSLSNGWALCPAWFPKISSRATRYISQPRNTFANSANASAARRPYSTYDGRPR